jgi:protein gp37
MNKTKIDWADMTWNPVTGCLHGCEYCYARRIAQRFGNSIITPEEAKSMMEIVLGYEEGVEFEISRSGVALSKPVHSFETKVAYPFGFAPTFHRYRLKEPQHIKKPQRIFVCSMADLFGDWVSDQWVHEVFTACEKAPWHQYLFLTKNGERYEQLGLLPDKDNFWYGTTRTGASSRLEHGASDHGNTFLSIEPILAPLDEVTLGAIEFWDWVIIGAETGSRKGKVNPKREWVERIANTCLAAEVPVFMKSTFRELMGKDFIQQTPWDRLSKESAREEKGRASSVHDRIAPECAGIVSVAVKRDIPGKFHILQQLEHVKDIQPGVLCDIDDIDARPVHDDIVEAKFESVHG